MPTRSFLNRIDPHRASHVPRHPACTYAISDMRAFQDRHDAGRKLSQRFGRYVGNPDTIVLGLPRGGIPVAYEIATAIGAPLDVLVVRKLGVPGHQELAM